MDNFPSQNCHEIDHIENGKHLFRFQYILDYIKTDCTFWGPNSYQTQNY